MRKNRTLTHNEREQLKKDYIQAYRLVHGESVHLGYDGFIEYRRGWWYLMRTSVAVPFSTKEIEAMTENLRKRIPPRADSDDDGDPD